MCTDFWTFVFIYRCVDEDGTFYLIGTPDKVRLLLDITVKTRLQDWSNVLSKD